MTKVKFMNYRLLTIGILAIISMIGTQQVCYAMLVLPQVPDSITDIDGRATYLAYHYWDNLEASSTQYEVADLEQALVDYIDLLPRTGSDEAMRESIDVFLNKIHPNKALNDMLWGFIEQYLFETESPMLNESLFEMFLAARLRQPSIDMATSIRLKDKLSRIQSLREGDAHPELRLSTSDGDDTLLSDLIDGKYAILLIYDSDCTKCRETISTMLADSRLAELIASRPVTVVAVNIGDDADEHPCKVDGWAWARANDEAGADEIFGIRSTPALYLISPQHTIMLKDVSYERLQQAIFPE